MRETLTTEELDRLEAVAAARSLAAVTAERDALRKALEDDRGACARIADELRFDTPSASYDNGATTDGWRMACAEIAAAIRVRALLTKEKTDAE